MPQIAINHLASKIESVETGGNKAMNIAVSFNQGSKMPQIAINSSSSKIGALESGDTPLHIAARNKNIRKVESLLNIQGINKDSVNDEGLTALDIARENTEHHESHKIIRKLANYPPKGRHFLYIALKVTSQKYENVMNLVNKAYDDRRNKELVVAVLLATMSFTPAFTIPSGFQMKVGNGETKEMITFHHCSVFHACAQAQYARLVPDWLLHDH
ncbi:ankyrin repeat-containing protein At5g02620-like [Cryptomeria japonica]|uniref:ankyrin repeat-containing protein At5g02620-like n=1 Tax=Cryptomeria japonica TaxID=3369 RepID=UPI0027DA8456|nr:ankyrin repeat-containing protein At5g02620-like [Cryptomeria japonica]